MERIPLSRWNHPLWNHTKSGQCSNPSILASPFGLQAPIMRGPAGHLPPSSSRAQGVKIIGNQPSPSIRPSLRGPMRPFLTGLYTKNVQRNRRMSRGWSMDTSDKRLLAPSPRHRVLLCGFNKQRVCTAAGCRCIPHALCWRCVTPSKGSMINHQINILRTYFSGNQPSHSKAPSLSYCSVAACLPSGAEKQ
ncbi:hypothetical protein BJX76DRAFT_189703 [Aspergillus varians]